MKAIRCLGVFMDHTEANFFGLENGEKLPSIESEFTHQRKIAALSHSESGMHHKEHQEQEKYYKKIGEEIIKYDRVLLFGPTDAKLELHNLITSDKSFGHVVVEVEATDKMTENQQKAFVKEYFKKFNTEAGSKAISDEHTSHH